MRFLQPLLILCLLAAVIYLFFRQPEQIVTVHETTTIVADTPIKRLSTFVDAHHKIVFSPLDEKKTIISDQELRKIQATLRDLRANSASEDEKKLYQVGEDLCSLMLDAIREGEDHMRRLRDSKSKDYSSPMDKPENREAEAEKRRALFEGAIHRSWESTSDRLRKQIGLKYDYMRLLER